MVTRLFWILALLPLLTCFGCAGGGGGSQDGNNTQDAADGNNGQDVDHQDAGSDAGSDAGTDAGADAGTDTGTDGGSDGNPTDQNPQEGGLGATCTCQGSACDQVGVPKPASGTIIGCGLVPTNLPGGVLACIRSYGGTLAPKTYYANGYCSLIATNCSGSNIICGSAVFGTYDSMSACPAGSVMITDSQDLTIGTITATIGTKYCAKSCTDTSECRPGENDPVLNETTQYQCNDKNGVKFCYDPRNLTANYTATAF